MEIYEILPCELNAKDIIALCANQRAAYELYRRKAFVDKYLETTGRYAEDEGGICASHKISISDIKDMCTFINQRYRDITKANVCINIDKAVYECDDITLLPETDKIQHAVDSNGFNILELTDQFWADLRLDHLADVIGVESAEENRHLVEDPYEASDIKNKDLQIESIDIKNNPNAVLYNVLNVCDVSGDLYCLLEKKDFQIALAEKFNDYIEQDPQYYELREDSNRALKA